MDRNDIVELIKASRLQEALKALEKATQGSHLHNDIIALSAAYAEYTRQNRSATEDFQTLEIQRAKITNSLLSVLDEVAPEDLEKAQITTARPLAAPPQSSSNKTYIMYGVLGTLALIILFVLFSDDPSDETLDNHSTNTEVQGTNTQNSSDLTRNIHLVEYRKSDGNLGVFEMEGNEWVEDNNINVFKYKEIKRDQEVIYLRDDKRGFSIELDLKTKEVILITDKDPNPRVLHKIDHCE